jgi:HECT-domain (ubiquitin-transferase)
MLFPLQFFSSTEFFGDDFLVYYRFLGRVMGKALFDRQLVAGHMVPYIYKHMLGWPITFKDIEGIDEEYYNNLKQLQQLDANGEDLSLLMLDFTVAQEIMGVKEQVDLIENGADVEVTNDNFPEYLESCLKYRMMMAVKPQLTELLLGFFDVVPEPLLTVFDFQELELLMCGLPVIDLDDWKQHTEYSGDYEMVGSEYPTCQWFWTVVEEFDQEMKARLLQFVTGTSGVPSRGFGVLQGNDGNIRKFTIHGVSVHTCLYPRAHTCFNRIDLPAYETLEELRERLKLAVTMVATGFDIE